MGVPEDGWHTAPRIRPVRGSRQVIDVRIIVAGKHIRAKRGSIALEIDRRQARAVGECAIPEVRDVALKINLHQVCAPGERKGTDVREAVGCRDAGQGEAVGKRPVPDPGDWIAVDRVREGHCTAGARIFSDGDLAAIGVQVYWACITAGPTTRNTQSSPSRTIIFSETIRSSYAELSRTQPRRTVQSNERFCGRLRPTLKPRFPWAIRIHPEHRLPKHTYWATGSVSGAIAGLGRGFRAARRIDIGVAG